MNTQHQIQHTLWFSDLEFLNQGDLFQVGDQEAHHAVRVKRVRTNERVRVLDGVGRVGIARLVSIQGSKSSPILNLEIESIQVVDRSELELEIWAALPKGDRLDRMIDQLTQLGVSRFRALITDRSQRKLSTVRPEKLDRIIQESSKQCHRAWKMEFGGPISFVDALGSSDNDQDSETQLFIADGSGVQINSGLVHENTDLCVVLIGPEGGWSTEEREMMESQNVQSIRLGSHVLRTETAASAAAAILLAHTA